ncbi:MAG: NUDIX hydrolase [Proteobacteria bacterium]|nr:NUDIX hydrolase [Pseudomonadota bacterium]
MTSRYNSESEFLAAYDPAAYDRPSITADIIIFSVSSDAGENWRRADKKTFSVLLVHRDDYPFLGKWNLPGGFVGIRETSMDAAHRVLSRETGLPRDIYVEQLFTFDSVDRDPRMRVFSIAFMALVNKNNLQYRENRTAKWFDVKLADGRLILTDADGVRLSESELAFDHAEIIRAGILRLRNKIEYTDIVFDMMPPTFTLGELQQVYEAILGKKLLAPAFRRTIAAKVRATGKMQTGFGHRPSALFKYRGHAA